VARGGKTVFTVKTEALRPRRKLSPPLNIRRYKKGDFQRRNVRVRDLEGD
jgi:hypothetical protein